MYVCVCYLSHVVVVEIHFRGVVLVVDGILGEGGGLEVK